MRIRIVVMNSVLHDARVLKEADSLTEAGHDVDIVGVFDRRVTNTDYIRPSGVRIHLCQPPFSEAVNRIWVCLIVALLLLSLATIFVLSWHGVLSRDLVAALVSYAAWTTFWGLLFGASAWAAVLLSKSIVERNAASVDVLFTHLDLKTKVARKTLSIVKRTKRNVGGGIRRLKKVLRPVEQWIKKLAKPTYARLRIRDLVDYASADTLDILHCHDLKGLEVGAEIKRRTGAPLVWDAHEIYEEVAQGDAAHSQYCRKVLARLQGEVDFFITINDSIAEFYKKHYPLLPSATIVKNAAVYVPSQTYDGRLHEAAGIPRSQRVALYQGGFAEKRGLRSLVQAAAHFNEDWTLVMMGWGSIENELKHIASSVLDRTSGRPTPAVVFLPPAKQSELIKWTAGGSVGLIPYENVGLNHLYCTPNKLWEYPAAGVPILCSDLAEMAKSVSKNGIGWVLPDTENPNQIAALINALETGELRTASAACLSFIERDNWNMYSDRLVQLYARIQRHLGQLDNVIQKSPAQAEARR